MTTPTIPATHRHRAALDPRALVVLRENLAFHSPLADFAFAMQGLGRGGSISQNDCHRERQQSDRHGAAEVQRLILGKSVLAGVP